MYQATIPDTTRSVTLYSGALHSVPTLDVNLVEVVYYIPQPLLPTINLPLISADTETDTYIAGMQYDSLQSARQPTNTDWVSDDM